MSDSKKVSFKQRKLISFMLIGVTLISISSAKTLPIKLVWNASASVPVGLYSIVNQTLNRGDLVLVRLPMWVQNIADQRGYLPSDVPALKRVFALKGDQVCRCSGTIFVNGMEQVKARLRDNAGRNMPVWMGCIKLTDDQVFLLTDHLASFDGRYFGVVELKDVLGVAEPVWIPSQ